MSPLASLKLEHTPTFARAALMTACISNSVNPHGIVGPDSKIPCGMRQHGENIRELQYSVFTTAAATPSALLLALELLHLPTPSCFRLLKLLHALPLLWAGLTRDGLPPCLDYELMKLTEAGIDVLVLLSSII